MKLFIALCLVSCIGLGFAYPKHSRSQSNVTDIIRQYGYPCKNYTVQTEDGYLLDLIRIPYGRGSQSQDSQESGSSSSSSSSSEENASSQGNSGKRPAVLLMHNYLSSAEDFVAAGPKYGFAFYLADQGYDVFIGNTRGNIYGQRHTTLNPDRDAAFWNFCWHHMGVKDLPAIVDKVLQESNQEKTYYVGHMQGSTIFYVMASERPEYNDKIEKMASMGPVAYLSHTTDPILKKVAEHEDSKSWLIKNIGQNAFNPSSELIHQNGHSECMRRGLDEQICKNVYFLLFGYDPQYFNMTTVNQMSHRVPAGGSTKQMLHYAQMVNSGKFAKFTQDDSTEEYDLSKVSTPVGLYYVPQDMFAPEADVETLKSKLPNVADEYKFQDLSNSIDLLYAKNVDRYVFDKVAQFFKKQ